MANRRNSTAPERPEFSLVLKTEFRGLSEFHAGLQDRLDERELRYLAGVGFEFEEGFAHTTAARCAWIDFAFLVSSTAIGKELLPRPRAARLRFRRGCIPRLRAAKARCRCIAGERVVRGTAPTQCCPPPVQIRLFARAAVGWARGEAAFTSATYFR